MARASSDRSLVERTEQFLARLGVTASDCLLIAVSGGLDSITLAHVLCELFQRGSFAQIAVAHVDHRLRGKESEADAAFVEEFARGRSIPVFHRAIDVRRQASQDSIGLEEAARNVRYAFFSEVAASERYNLIATAHTANDQAETVILNAVRGTGVRGLAAIPARRPLGEALLIRPWLGVGREEIQAFAESAGLDYREDSSNAELEYNRNRVRHIVMPALTEAFPERDPIRALASLAQRMALLERFLNRLAGEKLELVRGAGGGLNVSGLLATELFLLHGLLEVWIEENAFGYRLTAEESHRIHAFLQSDDEALELRGGLRFVKRGGELQFEDSISESFEDTLLDVRTEWSLETPAGVLSSLPSSTKGTQHAVERFDREQIPDTLLVRPWRAGDRIEPFGMPGRTKLVSDVLNEAGILGARKKNYPVVIAGEEILWVPGVRRSEFAKLSDATTDVLELSFVPRIQNGQR